MVVNGPVTLAGTLNVTFFYRFQASSNLVDWVDLSTNTPPGEFFRFVDLEASGLDYRFYRAVSP